MLGLKVHPGMRASEPVRALVLYSTRPSVNEQNLVRLLDFLHISWSAMRIDEIPRESDCPAGIDRSNFCILSSAACFAETLKKANDFGTLLPQWLMSAKSVYVYGFERTTQCKALLQFLTGVAQADLRDLNKQRAVVSAARDFPEMCGPMSGIRVSVQFSEGDLAFDFQHQASVRQSIISADDEEVFLSVTRQGVQFFLNACSKIIDISRPAAKYFDVKDCYCSAVPVMMYLLWAFRDICWMSGETNACLIVDDPPLRPRYGYLRFREVSELAREHNFAVTVAFIPWNWKRTNEETVNIFKANTQSLSICVHGCDHTSGEFASRSSPLLDRRAKTANQRMKSLRQRSGLRNDEVMVFPQGSFSPEAGRILKLNGFVAAVNTEVAPSNDAKNGTTIAELWNTAIMKYGSFPIFTRRYITHGIENFAFDGLLGKPCLIASHHDVFKDHGTDLLDFMLKLNSLRYNLRWRPLGETISRSFKTHSTPDGTYVVQMCAGHLVMQNPSKYPREFLVVKQEDDWDCANVVVVNDVAIHSTCDGGYLRFRLTLSPGADAEIRIVYAHQPEREPIGDSITHGIKSRLRRHLSEFRDNYLSQNEFLHQGAARIRHLLK